MVQKWSKNDPKTVQKMYKMVQKWSKNDPKMVQNVVLIGIPSMCEWLGTIPKVGIPTCFEV